MVPQEVIAFANENPACFMATMDNDQPRVRGMLLFSCDEKGFIFSTGKPKNMYKQLEANPKVELCFYAPTQNKMMRIAGKVEFLNDIELKTKILDTRPYLKPIIKTPDNPMFAVFRISRGRAYFWTIETNMLPPKFIEF